MPRKLTISLALVLLVQIVLVGCLGAAQDGGRVVAPTSGPAAAADAVDATGPPPPPGEELTGLQPIDLIFGGSVRHPLTRVLLVPPAHGDLGEPTNMSRSALSYLEATLTGIFAWEPAIDEFIAEYPEFSYLDEVAVQVELLEGETPATAGYDVIIGYVETSGPLFRGIAISGVLDTQRILDEAGLGDLVHYSNRYILLSLFASAPRAGQQIPDYPETHEVRGVTMHEFAHTWGLGHSTTWTAEFGPDLMNSPYPFVYGDGEPIGDGGERSVPLCITSLDLYGLAWLYRWLPNGTWEGSSGQASLPAEIPYRQYCVEEEASARAEAFLSHRSAGGASVPTVTAVTTKTQRGPT